MQGNSKASFVIITWHVKWNELMPRGFNGGWWFIDEEKNMCKDFLTNMMPESNVWYGVCMYVYIAIMNKRKKSYKKVYILYFYMRASPVVW